MEVGKKKRILFIAPLYKDRSPSQRFRFEQYISFLEDNNYICEVSNLISPQNDKMFYSKGNALSKMVLLIGFFFKRLNKALNASKYDIIFVHRETCFVGLTIFERIFAKKTNLIFDFDDAIWMPNVSNANKKFEWLKNNDKIQKIISYSKVTIAGNEYLKEFASKYNSNVRIIPTTIDTVEYKRIPTKETDKVTIGWSGSVTTIQHFEYALPFLRRLKEKYSDRIEIKVIGDQDYLNQELDIKGVGWKKETEIEELSTIDIGLMPLPDDKWAEGKCGLKGLQYMALEISTIMSPVGVNSKIIQDGENGFLASSEEEWIDKISQLVESKELREKLGEAGRKTVLEQYSVEANKQKYLDLFNAVLSD